MYLALLTALTVSAQSDRPWAAIKIRTIASSVLRKILLTKAITRIYKALDVFGYHIDLEIYGVAGV